LLDAATADAETCCQRETATVAKCNATKVFPDKIYKSVQAKGEDVTGMTCECGVFGAIACGEDPTNVSVEYEFMSIETVRDIKRIWKYLNKNYKIQYSNDINDYRDNSWVYHIKI